MDRHRTIAVDADDVLVIADWLQRVRYHAGMIEVVDDSAVHAALTPLRERLDQAGEPIGRNNPEAIESAYERARVSFDGSFEA